MPISQSHSGTATVGATELDLPSNTTTLSDLGTDGIFQLFFDAAAMTATESYKLRIYERALAASPQRLIEEVVLSGVQGEALYVTPALLLMHGWTFTLQKLQGTDRSFSWSIRQVA
jgi:hypothetical protein